jgi:uncharacterized C2H2 Zn-finger protein
MGEIVKSIDKLSKEVKEVKDNLIQNVGKEQEKGKIKCKKCTKEFRYKKELTEHMKKEHGERKKGSDVIKILKTIGC